MQILKPILSLTFLLLFSITVFSQNNETDSISKEQNNTNIDSNFTKARKHSPKAAAIMSAVVPGLGQIYNRKYWKVPIVYAAYGTTVYFLMKNNSQYIKYREAYRQRVDGTQGNETLLIGYETEDLRILKNYYWKNRDLSFLILIGVHALNILDAAVDAHLYYYNINDDLSFFIDPSIQKTEIPGFNPAGFTFTFNF